MAITIDPKAKALIFDLDGTLSDSLPVHVATWNTIGEKLGFIFDEQIVYDMTGRPTIEFAKRIISENNLSISPEEMVKLKQEAFWEMVHLIKPIEEVVTIVKNQCHQLPMAVGTGASKKSAVKQLTTLNLMEYFEVIVTADDVTKHKPEPETFLKCAEKMGILPEDCQVFEDGDLGIIAAKLAGMMVTDVRPFINYGKWVLS